MEESALILTAFIAFLVPASVAFLKLTPPMERRHSLMTFFQRSVVTICGPLEPLLWWMLVSIVRGTRGHRKGLNRNPQTYRLRPLLHETVLDF
jgi:hypothetical protein